MLFSQVSGLMLPVANMTAVMLKTHAGIRYLPVFIPAFEFAIWFDAGMPILVDITSYRMKKTDGRLTADRSHIVRALWLPHAGSRTGSGDLHCV
ncbi:hypothetical protein [Paraburkholderia dilworthii]|uniref:hypothetical protein n=1 Tax=Paraburkholderia dilworthii TaxID=948106 RepID=UPI0012686E41|nr:hypothetical protein [Paraburkholderia dilworthii]